MEPTRTIRWEGGVWSIYRYDTDTPVLDSSEAKLRDTHNEIHVRYYSDDRYILSLIHEALHRAFPHMKDEGIDEERIQRAEVVLKTFLEALEIDLTPALRDDRI